MRTKFAGRQSRETGQYKREDQNRERGRHKSGGCAHGVLSFCVNYPNQMSSNYNNPDLMVIGDSLAQGCRSMTVNAKFCAASYPALVANLAGLNLCVPDHKRDVLIDIQGIASDLLINGATQLLVGIGDNYNDWLQGFMPGQTNSKSAAPYFDNLAVAGFTIADVIGSAGSTVGTPNLADKIMNGVPNVSLLGGTTPDQLSGLHLAVNGRFVLNPSNDPKYANWSQVQWVLARQPRNLIVHMGHNDGLYEIGSKGLIDDWNAGWVNGGAPALNQYLNLLQTLVTGLPNTKIVVLGLPKVGAVANLMPCSPARLPNDANYFAAYQTTFPAVKVVTGDFVRSADLSIQSANGQLAQKVASLATTGAQISFYSVYDFFAQYDIKNLGPNATPIHVNGYSITNTYLTGQLTGSGGSPKNPRPPVWKFASGGFQSLDGMHPTSIGYALLAGDLASRFTPAPVPAATQAALLSNAVSNEDLLNPFPQCLDGTFGFLDIMNRFSASTPEADPGKNMILAAAVTQINADC